MDFTIFYKSAIHVPDDWMSLSEYDFFISTYDCSERVNHNYQHIKAKEKHWLLTPHHKIGTNLPTTGRLFKYDIFEEDNFLIKYFAEVNIPKTAKLCVDITGFIRPFIIFLFRYLHAIGFKKIDVIYSEPNKYIKSEETEFSGFVSSVDPVPGCSASDILPSSENDVLIMAVGYDEKLIKAVSDNKKHCAMKYKIFGFPSMKPDMYQESVLQVHNARESIGSDAITIFAPAFDPFVTAELLNDTINSYLSRQVANVYLSPISTKPQVLGFIIYYLYEGIDKPINILFPYSRHYSINTCQGISKTWLYVVELP